MAKENTVEWFKKTYPEFTCQVLAFPAADTKDTAYAAAVIEELRRQEERRATK